MVEKMTSPSPEDTRLLALAWLEALPRQIDIYRSAEAFQEVLTKATWYRGPGRSYFYITGIEPHRAGFHALNLDGKKGMRNISAVRTTIKEIMADLQLPRLDVTIPAPLTKVRKACRDLGFKHEGCLRRFTIFDGEPTDVHVMSVLFDEYNTVPPKRKRRRRGRRKPARNTGSTPGK